MKFGSSGQDYLEAIYDLEKISTSVRSVDVAERLSVSRASVSRATDILKDLGYIEMEKYSQIKLTEEGRKAAYQIKSRHNTLKCFLRDILGVEEDIAEDDACKMEHNISKESFGKLKAFLESISDLPTTE